MKIENVDVREFIQTTREEINLDTSISSSLKSSLNKLTTITIALVDRLAINSGNSSKPPSLDPNRVRKTRMDKGWNKRYSSGDDNDHQYYSHGRSHQTLF